MTTAATGQTLDRGYHVAIVSLFGCNSGVMPMFSFEWNKGLGLTLTIIRPVEERPALFTEGCMEQHQLSSMNTADLQK